MKFQSIGLCLLFLTNSLMHFVFVCVCVLCAVEVRKQFEGVGSHCVRPVEQTHCLAGHERRLTRPGPCFVALTWP